MYFLQHSMFTKDYTETTMLHIITCRNCFAGQPTRNEKKAGGGTEKGAVPTRTSNVCSHIFIRCCQIPKS